MKSPEESLGISSKEYNEIVNDCLYGESKYTEWSTDDKNKLLIIEQILNCANLLISSQELTEIKNWLKSLKQRIKEG